MMSNRHFWKTRNNQATQLERCFCSMGSEILFQSIMKENLIFLPHRDSVLFSFTGLFFTSSIMNKLGLSTTSVAYKGAFHVWPLLLSQRGPNHIFIFFLWPWLILFWSKSGMTKCPLNTPMDIIRRSYIVSNLYPSNLITSKTEYAITILLIPHLFLHDINQWRNPGGPQGAMAPPNDGQKNFHT